MVDEDGFWYEDEFVVCGCCVFCIVDVFVLGWKEVFVEVVELVECFLL